MVYKRKVNIFGFKMSFVIDFLVKGVWKKINLIEGIDNIDVKIFFKSYKIVMVLNMK